MQVPHPVSFNLAALDSIVQHYLEHQNSVEDVQPAEGLVPDLHVCYQVHGYLAGGQIQAAYHILENRFPRLLLDQRLLFRLKKQVLIEILRGSAPDRDTLALACARKELAPLALDAYPEAYNEFKQSLLLFMFCGPNFSCLASQWNLTDVSESAREELAGMVFQTLLNLTGNTAPHLHLLLVYLCNLHARYLLQAPPAGQDPSCSLEPSALLLGSRDEPPLSPDPAPQQARPLREADVQAVMQGAGVQRHAAMEALRRVGERGTAEALKQELGRQRLRQPLLRELVAEYAAARGLSTPSAGAARAGQHAAVEPMDTDDLLPAAVTARSLLEAPSDVGRSREGRSSSCSPPLKVMRLQGPAHPPSSSSGAGTSAQAAAGGMAAGCSGSTEQLEGEAENPRAALARIIRAAEEGDPTEVEAAVRAVAPGLLEESPHLLLQLRRCHFLQLLQAEGAVGAMHYLRRQLAPLAEAQPQLRSEVAAVTTCLLSSSSSTAQSWPQLVEVAAALQAEVSSRLGLQAPRLVQLLQMLLQSHSAWFQLQRCSDPFAAPLQLDTLRKLPGAGSATATGATQQDAAQQQQQAVQDVEEGVDEDKVLQIMEILELPRGTVVDMLRESNGNVEEVLLQVFG